MDSPNFSRDTQNVQQSVVTLEAIMATLNESDYKFSNFPAEQRKTNAIFNTTRDDLSKSNFEIQNTLKDFPRLVHTVSEHAVKIASLKNVNARSSQT